MIKDRIVRLRDYMKEKSLEAIIVKKIENVYYFSGFRGDDTLLIVTEKETFLITDARYTEQAEMQAQNCIITEQKQGLFTEVIKLLQEKKLKQIGFEGNSILFNEYRFLVSASKNNEKYISINLDVFRQVKEKEEISFMEKAAIIADRAFEDIINFIRPGMTEIEVANRLELKMKEFGSERPAFTTIVASGVRGSLPHGVATEKLIVAGEFVTMDYGAVVNGYHSDITRTVAVGKIDDEKRRVYDIVLQAQLLGINHLNPKTAAKEVDFKVRKYLEKQGYLKFFSHGLGHSIGLECHEEPRLSSKSTCDSLEEGMILTVEPGVYIPGWGGIRIEDTVLLTAEGAKRLTCCSKQLKEII